MLILIAPLITTPYVSRILGARNIGIYQYTQSIAMYFVLIGAVGTSLYGQREVAYVQDKPNERTLTFWEIESFRIVASLICTMVYFLVFCLHGRYPAIYTILTFEVLATAFDISWFFMGLEIFKLTVIRNTAIKLAGIICVFLFVKDRNDLGIYTACMTVPILLGNLSLWLSLRKYLVKIDVSISQLIKGAQRRLSPIFVLFLPQIAMDVYLVLDKTMIGLLATDMEQVGYYSQAQKIVQMILRIVTSFGVVMLPSMSAAYARGDYEGIKRTTKTAFRFIYMLSYALFFGLWAITPRFVPIFFGDGFEPVAPLITAISPILVIIATSNVLGRQYLLPTNQQKAFTVSILAGAGVNFILNLVLIHYWNAIGASVATVAAELAVTLVQCYYVKEQINLMECLSSGGRYAIFGAIMFLICRGVGRLLPPGKIWAIAVMVIVGVFIFGTELYLTKDAMLEMGIELLKTRKKE